MVQYKHLFLHLPAFKSLHLTEPLSRLPDCWLANYLSPIISIRLAGVVGIEDRESHSREGEGSTKGERGREG